MSDTDLGNWFGDLDMFWSLDRGRWRVHCPARWRDGDRSTVSFYAYGETMLEAVVELRMLMRSDIRNRWQRNYGHELGEN